MKKSISLKELIAYFIRYGRLILILALICGVLAGLYEARASVKEAQTYADRPFEQDKEYQKYLTSQEEYEREKAALEALLENNRDRLRGLLEYDANSILARVNPYEEWVSSVTFLIEPEDTADVASSLDAITSRYLVLFDDLTLRNNLDGYEYAGKDEKYIREMLTLSSPASGTLVLKAIGVAQADADHLAAAVTSLLQASYDDAAKSAGAHSLTVVSRSSKMVVDEALAVKQNEDIELTLKVKDQITVLDGRIKAQTIPSYQTQTYSRSWVVRRSMQYVGLGAVLGVFLALFVLVVKYLYSDRVEFSTHLSDELTVPFFGFMSTGQNLWERLSDRYMGERLPEDAEKALGVIGKTSAIYLKDISSVAVLSSLDIDGKDEAVSRIMQALGGEGKTVRFAGSASASQEAAEILTGCDSVVLIESRGKSRWRDILSITELTKAAGKKISGFIMR